MHRRYLWSTDINNALIVTVIQLLLQTSSFRWPILQVQLWFLVTLVKLNVVAELVFNLSINIYLFPEGLQGQIYLLESSSLFVRFRELTPRFRFARLMKDERVSLGLHPGSGTDAALERPGTFSKRSWQPMSLTSNVPGSEVRQYTSIQSNNLSVQVVRLSHLAHYNWSMHLNILWLSEAILVTSYLSKKIKKELIS